MFRPLPTPSALGGMSFGVQLSTYDLQRPSLLIASRIDEFERTALAARVTRPWRARGLRRPEPAQKV